MKQEKPEITNAIKALTEGSVNGQDHPELETLAAYHERRLDPEEIEPLQDHLAICGTCTRTLLDFVAFSETETGTRDAISDEDVLREWAGFRDRAQTEAPSAAATPEPSRSLFARPAFAYAAAAVFFVAFVGLSVQVVSLNKKLENFSRPQIHDRLTDLVPQSLSPDRGAGEDQKVNFSAETDRILLWLNRTGTWEEQGYRVTIVNATGEILWQDEKVNAQPDSTFVLLIPRHFLPPGKYIVQLFGSGQNNLPKEEYEWILED